MFGVAHALFNVFIARWREQQSRLRQSEHMAQIGVLTAGLAHEMNNPAAAVTRGSSLVAAAVERRVRAEAAIPHDALVPGPSAAGPSAASPMERAEDEDSLETALDGFGIEEAWRVAPVLAEAGYRAADLDLHEATAAAVVEVLASRAEVDALVAEVAEGSRRLSDLVAALKSYSYLDQAPVQNVDVARGIEDTLLILKSKTSDLTVVRDYESGLPTIQAYGSRLNQVWTNLIDNAADAIHDAGTNDGQITLTARTRDESIVITVANNGPEIPPPVRDRIFEAFFTTKNRDAAPASVSTRSTTSWSTSIGERSRSTRIRNRRRSPFRSRSVRPIPNPLDRCLGRPVGGAGSLSFPAGISRLSPSPACMRHSMVNGRLETPNRASGTLSRRLREELEHSRVSV